MINKKSFAKWAITKNSSGWYLLNPDWELYGKILQLSHIILNYEYREKKDKLENIISDLICLVSDEEIFNSFFKNINAIISVDVVNSLFSYFPSSNIFTGIVFLKYENLEKIFYKAKKAFNLEIDDIYKNKIKKIFTKISKENKRKINICNIILKNRDFIISTLIYNYDIFQKINYQNIFEPIFFQKNSLFFYNNENIKKKLNIIIQNIFQIKLNLEDNFFFLSNKNYKNQKEILMENLLKYLYDVGLILLQDNKKVAVTTSL